MDESLGKTRDSSVLSCNRVRDTLKQKYEPSPLNKIYFSKFIDKFSILRRIYKLLFSSRVRRYTQHPFNENPTPTVCSPTHPSSTAYLGSSLLEKGVLCPLLPREVQSQNHGFGGHNNDRVCVSRRIDEHNPSFTGL